MADDWDKEDYEPPSFVPKKPAAGDRWEGEDEDDVKDNWDDEEEAKDAANSTETPVVHTRKKKSLSQIIQEKEEKRRKEAREAMEQRQATRTAEDELAEKLRMQRMQEEADLELAKEAFEPALVEDQPESFPMLGGEDGLNTQEDSIDALQPVTKEDFDSLRKSLANKLSSCEKSPLYVSFLDDLLRDLSLNMEPEDVKRLSSSLNAVANEKVKQQKLKNKKKGGKKGASLNVGKDDGISVPLDDFGTEYDDFM